MDPELETPATETSANQSTNFSVETIEDLQKILSNRVMCSEEGINYVLQVSSVSSLQVPDSGTPYHIVNFNALTPYHMQLIGDFVEEGEFTEAANVRVTARLRLGKEYIPEVKEKVKVSFAWGETKAGEAALFVDTVVSLPVAQAKKFDLTAFMSSRK